MDLPTQETRNSDDVAVVLLVDDQPYEADLLHGVFKAEEKLEFHSCTDPQQAIARANEIKPTVILQDILMPGGHGLSLVAAFRANIPTKETPIIVFSGLEEPKTKNLAFSLGANDYVEKKADRSELVARIRYHTKAFLTQRQRDEAYRALRESERQLAESNASLLETNKQLGEALAQVRQLRGLLPMCSYCKRVRDDQNYWSELESYLAEHSDLRVSHGVCFECFQKRAAELGYTPDQAALAAERIAKRSGMTSAAEPPLDGA
jgi:DNA-binding response OmpR family regulator